MQGMHLLYLYHQSHSRRLIILTFIEDVIPLRRCEFKRSATKTFIFLSGFVLTELL